MRVLNALLVLVCTAALVERGSGQTIQVTGTVKDGNGNPLNAALITVDNAQGKAVGHGDSNILGRYAVQARPGAVSVTCEVHTDSTIYTPNPDHEPLTITSKTAKGNCTLYQVTKDVAYWNLVGQTIDAKAANTHDPIKTYSVEWKKIDSSGLPPDSKAAAAHQFKAMVRIGKVTDYTFTAYAEVDQLTLSKALHGDQRALSDLPRSVAKDVKTFNSSGQE